jgi:hypothetical protein
MTLKIHCIQDIDILLEYLPYFQDQNNEFYEVIKKPQKCLMPAIWILLIILIEIFTQEHDSGF